MGPIRLNICTQTPTHTYKRVNLPGLRTFSYQQHHSEKLPQDLLTNLTVKMGKFDGTYVMESQENLGQMMMAIGKKRDTILQGLGVAQAALTERWL